jgi:hypothetical protein
VRYWWEEWATEIEEPLPFLNPLCFQHDYQMLDTLKLIQFGFLGRCRLPGMTSRE